MDTIEINEMNNSAMDIANAITSELIPTPESGSRFIINWH